MSKTTDNSQAGGRCAPAPGSDSGPRATSTFDLDGLYTPIEIAKWMRLSPRTVLDLARRGKIPTVRLNDRVLRFHPRTILSKYHL